MILASWCDEKTIFDLWKKMSQNNDGLWCGTHHDVQAVLEEPVDYYVIINAYNSTRINYHPDKTIIFRMEPNMHLHEDTWGEWAGCDLGLRKVFRHEDDYNNLEWHLSKTYQELLPDNTQKKSGILSTVLSGKYSDPGHVKRVDFVKFLERNNFPVHVYGENRWHYKMYKGSLPSHQKDNALLPYKYTFNVENHSIKNYMTEKLVDGILCECLTFYSGCWNAKDYIDERAFVYLELSNFQKDMETIKNAIREDWHTKRLPYIKEAKKKILTELQFFPRLEKIISSLE
jgi:hypothetical protein